MKLGEVIINNSYFGCTFVRKVQCNSVRHTECYFVNSTIAQLLYSDIAKSSEGFATLDLRILSR